MIRLPVLDFSSLFTKQAPPPRRSLKAKRVSPSSIPAPLRFKATEGKPTELFNPANIERARRERRL